MIDGVFIGAVAGIITYVIIQVIVVVFNNLIVPWYQSLVYRGTNIGGTWYGYRTEIRARELFEIGESCLTVYLKQNGNKITGELLLTTQPSGLKVRKLFKLSGVFYDNALFLDQRVRDKNAMGAGNYLMKLTDGGAKLKGKNTFISSKDWSTVFTNDEVWIRKDETKE